MTLQLISAGPSGALVSLNHVKGVIHELSAWLEYHDHLNQLQEPFTEEALKAWTATKGELLVKLLKNGYPSRL